MVNVQSIFQNYLRTVSIYGPTQATRNDTLSRPIPPRQQKGKRKNAPSFDQNKRIKERLKREKGKENEMKRKKGKAKRSKFKILNALLQAP